MAYNGPEALRHLRNEHLQVLESREAVGERLPLGVVEVAIEAVLVANALMAPDGYILNGVTLKISN